MASPRNIHLLVKLLEKYLYFYSLELPGLTAESVNSVIATLNKHMGKIQEELGSADSSVKEAYRVAHAHYQQTVKTIEGRSE